MFEVGADRGGHLDRRGWLAGGARRRVTFFACAKKVTKESTPCFRRNPRPAAVAEGGSQTRPCGAQTRSPTSPAAPMAGRRRQTGGESSLRNPRRLSQPLAERAAAGAATLFSPLPAPGGRHLSGEAEGQRKLFERSEFFRCPDKCLPPGVSPAAGRAFFGYFLCTSKESNWPPGHPRPTTAN